MCATSQSSAPENAYDGLMEPDTPDTIVIMVFQGFLTAGLVALVWARLNRIEDQVSQCVRREELEAFRTEVRAEMVAVRSDLTQIALAVGARRPHASEG
jgi:hypothetical protein